ncbi:unnamed protein product [Phaedon cochleariae]|uniref:Thioredoxin domain-containing protein n=1 Tax=Phaedon cochleariae TaxID=80249 RepID=A0A9N9SD27_PHACE|nr:unnamed protein product [Phaedon cochleariae]
MSLLKLTFKETKILSTSNQDSADNDINESKTSKFTTDSIKPEVEKKAQSFSRSEVPSVTIRMMNFCRELAIFCLIIVTYAALTKDPPKISKAPAAYPFFTKKAFLTDWYKGEISRAIESSRFGDIAFIMFYAPWDAESQAARKEFELAAEYMTKFVNFAAVNCWQPHSECRNQYSKVYRWPVLIAYLAHGRGVQYSGPISAPHMIQFLKKVSNPFTLITTDYPKDFKDAYVIAELDTSPGSLDFAVFYSTALKYLEKDPQYCISFYVKPVVIAKPALYLHLWNETLIYPIHEKQWMPDEILHWIIQSMHQMTAWVPPSGSKSITIYNSMSNGVALILFTPMNILHFGNDYYTMFQEIAQEYYNCRDDISVNFNSVNLELKRSASLLDYKKLQSTCRSNILNHKKLAYNVTSFWTNMSNYSHSKEPKSCDILGGRYSCNVCLSYFNPVDCQEIHRFNTIDETACESENKHFQIYTTSLLTGMNDLKSAKNLQKSFQQEKCRQFLMAEKLQPAIFENHGNRKLDISRLSCRSNESLTLLSMDSLLHYPFAQRLGIDLSKFADKSAAVILNEKSRLVEMSFKFGFGNPVIRFPMRECECVKTFMLLGLDESGVKGREFRASTCVSKMESHYILQGPINGVSLREFIMNYTLNSLNRSFDTISTLKLTKERQSLGRTLGSKIVIKQLDTYSFLPTIQQENKFQAIVVFYYTKQCSFCNGISYIYLTVAKKLSLVEDLEFTCIDGDLNILPWEYSMESYPTILFSPNKRKSESRVFPSGMSITVSNLTGFILTNLEPEMKLQAIWSLCRHTKLKNEQSSCYSSLLNETLICIDGTLKTWRKSNKRQKQMLLHKLKRLRQLHLLFAHHPEENEAIQNYFKKLNMYNNRKGDYRGGLENMWFKNEL